MFTKTTKHLLQKIGATDVQIEQLLQPKCEWCGYNGKGYWQTKTHEDWCPFHSIGGIEKRKEYVKKELFFCGNCSGVGALRDEYGHPLICEDCEGTGKIK